MYSKNGFIKSYNVIVNYVFFRTKKQKTTSEQEERILFQSLLQLVNAKKNTNTEKSSQRSAAAAASKQPPVFRSTRIGLKPLTLTHSLTQTLRKINASVVI